MTKTRRQVLAERAQRMRREMTRQERKLWYQFLKTYEFPFVTQKVMGNYILDFYCKKLHLSIELDGSQHFEPRALRYDRIRTTFLETEGQKVMGNYILDFYCKKLHLSIELDGSQHFEPRALRYDRIRTTFLETEGIKELRFTNRDIDESFEGVCEIIHQEAQKRRPDARQFQFDFMRLLEKS